FVHGILANNFDFARRMQEKLSRRLGDSLQYVRFVSVPWAGVVRNQEETYLGRSRAHTKHRKLRRLVVQALGDAAAYQQTEEAKNPVYDRVQSMIYEAVKDLDNQNRESELGNCPLIFIGHSLGAHIISTFIWDLNKLKQQPDIEGHRNQ